jgi:diguanylate cyclase (GGDEF)-like protein
LRNKEKNYKQLAYVNRKAVNEYNEKTLSTLLLLGWILVLFPLASVPFSNTKADAVPAYLLSFSIFFALFLLFKIPVIKKYTYIGLYASFSVLFLLGIYLSVIHSPDMRATILLGGFIIMPLSFIDRSHRSILFLAFWLVVHTVLAFYLKPQYALDDTLNCLCSAVLGCYLGKTLMQVRLEGYEAQRLLTIEKETDVLTGLLNRRKLFETLATLETTGAEKPSGMLMIDIDYFKDFNDNYGHASGDKYLNCFGETLTKFTQNFRLDFYRYGGEEFVGMAYGYDEEELLTIAESLRIAVQDTGIDGHHTTVSIGVAYCGDEHVRNYEKIIDRADKAAYAAKHAGRNKCYRAEQNASKLDSMV